MINLSLSTVKILCSVPRTPSLSMKIDSFGKSVFPFRLKQFPFNQTEVPQERCQQSNPVATASVVSLTKSFSLTFKMSQSLERERGNDVDIEKSHDNGGSCACFGSTLRSRKNFRLGSNRPCLNANDTRHVVQQSEIILTERELLV